MIIEKKLYEPMIHTIPDDCCLFSLLNVEDEFAKKIIMENYINFYAFKDRQYGNIVFRFENFMNYESILGLERCFIPIGMLKKYYGNLNIIVQLLSEDYAIMLPVSRKYISFYKSNPEGNHLLLIYGVDTYKKIFLCKDFQGRKFTKFQVTFKEMMDSIENYVRPFPKESDGLLAFRINFKESPCIDYAKVYLENYKMRQQYFSGDVGYGVGAIDLALYDVKVRPEEYILAERFFNLICYLFESSKLFKFRYSVLKNELNKMEIGMEDGEDIIKKLYGDTSNVLFKIEKWHLKGISTSGLVLEELLKRLYMCREDFCWVTEYFCNQISKLKKNL